MEPQFAGVFLNMLLGRRNEVDDLWLLDKALYRSLMSLKDIAGEAAVGAGIGGSTHALDPIAAVGLLFEVDLSYMGVTSTHELIPGGSEILVTMRNFRDYIHRYANFKLNEETRSQCKAFLAGFRAIIPTERMRMFSPREMQLLISGDQRQIDIADFRRNVAYQGGYHDSQPYIQVIELLCALLIESQLSKYV